MKKNGLILVMTLVASTAFAESFTMTEYVKVNSSNPMYSTITEDVPMEQCREVREAVSNGSSGNSNIIGTVVGGAAGGVLGNQIGGGRGKTIATIGGAVLGAFAGHTIGNRYNTPEDDSYQTVRKCETVYTKKSRQVMDGYLNIGNFKGQEIQVQSDEPLKRIPVTVTYSY